MSFLHGFGMYVPERVVPNQEIAERIGRTPEWIENATGIRERRWASPDVTVADLAVPAARECLGNASAASPGLIILASGTAPPGFPGPAAEVAARLGFEGAPALDVPLASAGSLFGMALAARLTEVHGDILVIGAEKMSSVIENADDPNTAILFGDGAGAALISARAGKWRILDAVLHSDGQFREDLAFDGSSLKMNGLSVIMQAARKLPSAIQEVLAKTGISPSEVSAFVMHQANQNLLLRVAKTLGVPGDRCFSNIARYGNTSSASMLIAAAEWAAASPPDGPVVFAAFGAGFHWGALVAVSG